MIKNVVYNDSFIYLSISYLSLYLFVYFKEGYDRYLEIFITETKQQEIPKLTLMYTLHIHTGHKVPHTHNTNGMGCFINFDDGMRIINRTNNHATQRTTKYILSSHT